MEHDMEHGKWIGLIRVVGVNMLSVHTVVVRE